MGAATAERCTQRPGCRYRGRQVVKVLLRTLQATQMAGRLANKLADYVKQYSIPQHTIDRIQEELKWVGLTPKQKTQQLLGQTRFSGSEFRRMGGADQRVAEAGSRS